MNGQAMQLWRKKASLWRTSIQTKQPIDYARYAICRNTLRSLTRQLRASFEEELAANIKHNPERFWQYTNSHLKTKSRVEELRDEMGAVASTDEDNAQMLNRFFTSIFIAEDLDFIPVPQNQFVGE